jgi:hypothetical protein
MLRSVKNLEGMTIGATDGSAGKVRDFFFDDQAWVIRYAIVNTGMWLGGRDVLISPYSIRPSHWDVGVLPVTLTKSQIEQSPGIDCDKPVSRQYENTYLRYYGYPNYWGGSAFWGEYAHPGMIPLTDTGLVGYRDNQGYLRAPTEDAEDNDPHLRSCNTVKGYRLRAPDGEIGHLDGYLVDDSTWSIRYLIVNTSNWWIGHQVLVSPEWIEKISWSDSTVTIDLERKTIQDAPTFDGHSFPDRDAEALIYAHYGQPRYWLDDPVRAVA